MGSSKPPHLPPFFCFAFDSLSDFQLVLYLGESQVQPPRSCHHSGPASDKDSFDQRANKMAGLNISNGNGSTEQTPLVTADAAVARSSFLQGDREASRQYHDSKKQHAASEDGHQTEGGFLKPIIFGGLDGILTSFAIVAGAAGGRLDPSVVLILGFSNIFADALSMGVGEFLSSKAENEWILSEREREEWYVLANEKATMLFECDAAAGRNIN